MIKQFLLLLFFITYYTSSNAITTARTIKIDQNSYSSKLLKDRILNFDADIIVHKDASLTITETINFNAISTKENKFFLRKFPIYSSLNKEHYKANYHILSVKKDDKDEAFYEETDGGWLNIYIGNSEESIKPGIYTYEIKYTIDRQIGFAEGYDELFWNVTGTEFDIRIDTVNATVHLPIGANILRNSCLTGIFASIESNCSATLIDKNTMMWQTTHLHANESLILSVAFKNNIIIPQPPIHFIEKYSIVIFLLIAFFGITIFCYVIWKKRYKPTLSIKHNEIPTLNGSNSKPISTIAIKNLVEKKHVSIKAIRKTRICGILTTTKYSLTPSKNTINTLSENDLLVMQELFPITNEISTHGVRNTNTTIQAKFNAILPAKENLDILVIPTILYLTTFFVAFALANFITGHPETIILAILILLFILIPYITLPILKQKKETFIIRILKMCFSACLTFSFISIFIAFYLALTSNTNNGSMEACAAFFVGSFIVLFTMPYMNTTSIIEKNKLYSDLESLTPKSNSSENQNAKIITTTQINFSFFKNYFPLRDST